MPSTDITAQDYLAAAITDGYNRGWSFTPLSGKRPTRKGWQNEPRPTLEQCLKWAASGNVGLRTGTASGIVVIDADPGADVEPLGLTPTVVVNTGRGRHFYFAHDGALGNSSGKLGPHIDVRATGGQVVFPGSIHPDTGQPYAYLPGCAPWEIELAPLPQHIADKLLRPNRYGDAALTGELARIIAAPVGERNDALNRAAFSLGQLVACGKLNAESVRASLTTAGINAGLTAQEVEATIRSGMDSGLANPRATQPPLVRKHEGKVSRNGLVLIPGLHTTPDGHVEQSTAGFADDVLAALPDDALYRRDHEPGEIVGPPGKRRFVTISTERTRLIVDSNVRLGVYVASKEAGPMAVFKPCNRDCGSLIYAAARVSDNVRQLELMVRYPVYGPDFRRAAPGWSAGIFYDEPEELRDLAPEQDAETIHNILHDLTIDFPFKSPSDRENFYGLLLTPIISAAIDGNRPMHLIQSPLERTGKSKLVNEVLGGILLGRDAPSMQITEREEEREKRILALLFHCETLVHFDNLPHFIDSPSIASLLTAESFMGRILQFSRVVNLRNYATLVGTGNNVQTSGEIGKRIIPILIEPATANPELRTNFHHPNIRGYVSSRRRMILECLLGMVENWVHAGRPTTDKPLGGFEAWAACVGGILKVNGFTRWRDNETAWRRQADTKGEELLELVSEWWATYSTGDTKAGEIRDMAKQLELFSWMWSKGEHSASVTFGRMLGRLADTPVGEWRIRRLGAANHIRYRLEPLGGEGDSGV